MASDGRKIADFPDVENKLQAPTKKSLFERQRAEAEAKRLREEAETKAVYEDFVKSFDDEDEAPSGSGFGGARYGGQPSQPPRRQLGGNSASIGFGTSSGPASGRGFGGPRGRNSGPGSLGPPPSSLNKKRTFDGFQQQQRRDDRGVLAFDDYEAEREREPKRVFQTSDDEDEDTQRAVERGEEKAVAKPTLRLSSLPSGTSPAVIKALIPTTLNIDSIRFLPPSAPGSATDRKSTSAIVTLAKDTPANDIDTTVNQLQNRYLGYGYYLSLHRHLSSAAISSTALPSANTVGTAQTSHPFGAKPVSLAPQPGRAPPPPHHNARFAPPTSYGPSAPNLSNAPLLHVPVQPPSSIKTLKTIHKTIELLLTHGPEFEALLMTRPVVQRSEHWAWIWDARSAGGVYYRWRLWSILTSSKSKGRYIPLFEGSHAWKAPEKENLAWEYTTKLSEFVSDSEYNSSDEDDSDNESSRRPPPTNVGISGSEEENAYLTPLAKAKLTHLLARLPTSTSLLRKGDVARITAFAISHAGKGADEVVKMLVSNILHPFAYSSANPNYSSKPKQPISSEEENEDRDHSSSQLIALYLISDILSSSSTSGVRHAWRYRSSFEAALKAHKVFEYLGRLERDLKWGRLRAEKWKRSVGTLLGLWEGWCVFGQDAMEGFRKVFEDPPKTEEEEREERRLEEEREEKRSKARWKAVEKEKEMEREIDGEPMVEGDDEDVDGVPMDDDDDDDVDGVPMIDDDDDVDLNGQAMDEDNDEKVAEAVEPPTQPPVTSQQPSSAEALKRKVAEAMARKGPNAPTTTTTSSGSGSGSVNSAKKPRLTAADMFADSDEE